MNTKIRFLVLPLLALVLGAATPVDENEKSDGGKGATGLPLPRFASLRVGEVNLRTGPGTRYPILWVFERQGMPVEIIAEYEGWRRVRDADGDEGWLHKNALSGKRAALVSAAHDLRRDDKDNAAPAAHLEAGVTGQILSCKPDWCRLKVGNVKGWLKKSEFWGAYPTDVFD